MVGGVKQKTSPQREGVSPISSTLGANRCRDFPDYHHAEIQLCGEGDRSRPFVSPTKETKVASHHSLFLALNRIRNAPNRVHNR